MKLKLTRKYKKDNYIIGKLFIGDTLFCDSLERPWLNNQTDISCIPVGTYEVGMLYSPHFGRFLPHILNVPNRTDIMIHPCNTVDELKGCVGVGKNKEIGRINYSRHFSDLLNNTLTNLNEKIFIEIV